MIEIIFCIICACTTVIVAELLVKKQEKCHKIAKELEHQLNNDMEEAVDDYKTLTGEEFSNYSLTHLENNIKKFNMHIQSIKEDAYEHLERSKKCKTSKKHWK